MELSRRSEKSFDGAVAFAVALRQFQAKINGVMLPSLINAFRCLPPHLLDPSLRMTEHRPLGNIQEESLSNNGSRAPSPPALLDADLNTSPVTRYITPSPRAVRPRRGSSVSRVELGFFDREGIKQLERTLTHQSNSNKSNGGSDRLQSIASDTTLATKEGEPFDLAKTLRRVIQKSVSLCM